MKFIKILVIVIVGIGILIGLSFLNVFNPDNNNSSYTAMAVDSPFAKDLLDSINVYDKNNVYNLSQYEKLGNLIDSNLKENAIKKDEEQQLKENLNRVYSKHLNNEVITLFDNGCNASQLNDLRPHVNKMIQLGYADNLQESSSLYNEFDKVVNFINLSNHYTKNLAFNISKSEKFIKDSKRMLNLPITHKCSRLSQNIKSIPTSLEDKHFRYLTRKTNKLVNSTSTTQLDCQDMDTEISNFVNNNNYNSSTSSRRKKTTAINRKVTDKFLEIEEENSGYFNKN